MSGFEAVGVILAIPGLIALCQQALVAIQDVSTHLSMPDSLAPYFPQCKEVPKQVSTLISQIERHLGSMESLFDQDQGYLLDPLVQAAIEEFQVYAK